MKHDYKHVLRQKGLKITGMRLAVLTLMESAHRPLDIPELLTLLSQKEPADKVTLYRTITTLEKTGLVKRVMLKKRQAYYELNEPHEHHHHLTCQQCGIMVDVPGCQVVIKQKTLLHGTGFRQITDHSLEFTGICINCAK